MFGRKRDEDEPKDKMVLKPQTDTQTIAGPSEGMQRQEPMRYTAPWAPASQDKMMDAAVGSFEWHAYMVTGFMSRDFNKQKIDKIVSEAGTTLSHIYMMLMDESRNILPRRSGAAFPTELEDEWHSHMERFVDWLAFLQKSSRIAFPPVVPTLKPESAKTQPSKAPKPVAEDDGSGNVISFLLDEKTHNRIIENVVAHNEDVIRSLVELLGEDGLASTIEQWYPKYVEKLAKSDLRTLTPGRAMDIMEAQISDGLREGLSLLSAIEAGAEAADASITL